MAAFAKFQKAIVAKLQLFNYYETMIIMRLNNDYYEINTVKSAPRRQNITLIVMSHYFQTVCHASYNAGGKPV